MRCSAGAREQRKVSKVGAPRKYPTLFPLAINYVIVIVLLEIQNTFCAELCTICYKDNAWLVCKQVYRCLPPYSQSLGISLVMLSNRSSLTLSLEISLCCCQLAIETDRQTNRARDCCTVKETTKNPVAF